MKDVRLALREFLLGDAAIAAIVVDRVFPIKIPQGINLASIVYTRVSGEGDYTMQGPTGYARPRFQIDAWAGSANSASNLSNLVKDRLDGFRGVMGSGGNVIVVHGVFIADQREDFDDAAQLHRSGRDYFLHHVEL